MKPEYIANEGEHVLIEGQPLVGFSSCLLSGGVGDGVRFIQAFLSLISRSKSRRLIISSPDGTEAVTVVRGAVKRLRTASSNMVTRPRVRKGDFSIPKGPLINQLNIGDRVKAMTVLSATCRKGSPAKVMMVSTSAS